LEGKTISTSWRTPPAPIPDSEIAREYKADVVVVGLGHAGTPALRAAAETGASVIGIEKMSREKFMAWGGQIGHINSNFLAGKGVPKVDPIDFFNEWMRRAGNRANPKLIMHFAQKGGEAFDWYINPFTPEQLSWLSVGYWPHGKHYSGEISGQKAWPGPAAMYDPHFNITHVVRGNQDEAERHGARLFFGIDAQQLVKNGDRVTGVIGRDHDGQYIKYSAAKGVILAAGDFGSNKEMCADLLTHISDLFDESDTFFAMSRDGRGIQMGVWAGGLLEARPLATMFGDTLSLSGVIMTFGSLWLDANCKRYCNEGFGDPVFAGFPGAQEKRDTKYIVFDSSIFEDVEYGPPSHTSFGPSDEMRVNLLKESMAKAQAAGPEGIPAGQRMFSRGAEAKLYAANTLEELADYLQLDAVTKQNFLDTLKRYNEFCAAGRDEDFGKDAQLLHAIDAPPFYAELKPKGNIGNLNIGQIMVTCGGLLTDEYQNVLDQKKDPIPGLYATGNCCGRRFGLQYSTPVSGVSIGICVALGREVGRIVGEL